MQEFVLDILTVVGSIVLVDLILSGDNALVIGVAAASIQKPQRWLAIVLGGGGAIILRLIFAILATLLLRLPLLQAIGGLLLLLIAIRLLAVRKEKSPSVETVPCAPIQVTTAPGETGEVLPAGAGKVMAALPTTGLIAAILTIVIADVTMSLDNVLAVGALAHGNVTLLSAGILLSVIILMPCSALVAELIGSFPWLLDVAALLLAWTGASMILNDLRLGPLLGKYPWTQLVLPCAAFAIVLLADVLLRMHEEQSIDTKRPI